MNLMKEQYQAAVYRGLPTEEKNSNSTVVAVTGETVQFYYSNSGTRTADAGQAIGVSVEAVFAYNNIKNSQGKTVATNLDTSLSFTSTAFTTEVSMDWDILESLDNVTWASRLAAITAGLTAGQYRVDYAKGIAYGVKASTQTTLTAGAYKINTPSTTSGGGGGGGSAQPSVDSYTSVVIDLSAGSDQSIVSAPGANKQIWVYGYTVVCGTADGTTVNFEDSTPTELTGTMVFSQYGGTTVAPSGNFAMPLWKCATNKALRMDTATGDVDGTLYYAIVSV